MADAICLFIRLHVCTQADTDHPANPGAGSPVSSSSLPASVPQAPISSGWKRGPTWGLEGCPFVSRAPWVFWEQEGCESPARPLSSRMPGPLLATGRAFVAARAQERGQCRAWQGWAAAPGAQGLQNPHALWDGNGFSRALPAWQSGLENWYPKRSCLQCPHLSFQGSPGKGVLGRNHREKPALGDPSGLSVRGCL